jgi:hypothetical protein
LGEDDVADLPEASTSWRKRKKNKSLTHAVSSTKNGNLGSGINGMYGSISSSQSVVKAI